MNKPLENLFYFGIKALLCSRENKLLLLEKQHRTRGICWDIPGGRPQNQETAMETLRREVKEETGFEHLAEVLAFDMIVTDIRVPSTIGEVGLILSVYRCNINCSFIPQLSSEHTGFGWFSFSESAQLLKKQYPVAFVEKIAQMDPVH